MSALVLKSWAAKTAPIDEKNNYVKIVGRQGGLLSWFLSLVGIDPTTTILVGSDRLEFSSASLAGTAYRLIPLQNICSTYYGYHKPWKEAASIITLFWFMAGALAREFGGGSLIVAGFGLLIAMAYYLLNRTLTLGFVEPSGVISGIQFKRSVIENIDVDDEQAKKVCLIVQNLIERKQRNISQPRETA